MAGSNGWYVPFSFYKISGEDDEGLKPIIELLSRDGNKVMTDHTYRFSPSAF